VVYLFCVLLIKPADKDVHFVLSIIARASVQPVTLFSY